jgi:hypothetical protein
VPALDYLALGEERQVAETAEERRIFYVGMTRARERLILTGAAKLDEDGGIPDRSQNGPCAPIGWLAPALAGAGVEPTILSTEELLERDVAVAAPPDFEAPEPSEPIAGPAAPPSTLSYSALAAYERCGYRFYLERVLGLDPVAGRVLGAGALERGILVHELLERLDFRRPHLPDRLPEDVAGLLEGFVRSPLFERLRAATDVRREEGFSFLLASGALVIGALDVVAREPGGNVLVVDYKTDRIEGERPVDVVARDYRTQQLIYALAALRGGAGTVEVVHVFLERPEEPVHAGFADPAALEGEIEALAAGLVAGEFPVSNTPGVPVCNGCPGEGGLCSWPLEVTRRDPEDRDPEPESPGQNPPSESPGQNPPSEPLGRNPQPEPQGRLF